VDVVFDQPGQLALEHRTPNRTYTLAAITVGEERATPPLDTGYEVLRTALELVAERQRLDIHLAAPPDKTLALVAEMDDPMTQPGGGPAVYACPMHPEVTSDQPGRCPKCGMKLLATSAATTAHDHDHVTMDHGDHDPAQGTAAGIEWEDDMVEVNRLTTTATMHWRFLDRTSGADSPAIDWRFTVGERVKLRLVNEMNSDHPMHHPFHLHGAGRFLVLSRDGVVEPDLVWKDTVLVRTGQVVDILFDVTNPGLWMAHCHIAEHMQSGMMFSFTVARTPR
jgi:FtsP/CotA-like multicopper oxidase with cupredoxin domain